VEIEYDSNKVLEDIETQADSDDESNPRFLFCCGWITVIVNKRQKCD
jgi:hypothetical protein